MAPSIEPLAPCPLTPRVVGDEENYASTVESVADRKIIFDDLPQHFAEPRKVNIVFLFRYLV